MKKSLSLIVALGLMSCAPETNAIKAPIPVPTATPEPSAIPTPLPSPTVTPVSPTAPSQIMNARFDGTESNKIKITWDALDDVKYQVFIDGEKIDTLIDINHYLIDGLQKDINQIIEIQAINKSDIQGPKSAPFNIKLDYQKSLKQACPKVQTIHVYADSEGKVRFEIPEALSEEIINTTSISGLVFNDDHQTFKDAKVTLKILDESLCLENTVYTTSENGTYLFEGVPTGVDIEIKAFKAGFSQRIRKESILANPLDNSQINRFDFGNNGQSNKFSPVNLSLSNFPDVLSVGNLSESILLGRINLTFSERMDQQSVEDHIAIRAFSRAKLKVDSSTLPYTLDGSGSLTQFREGTKIFDGSDFIITWNNEGTQAELILQEGKAIPRDKEKELIYQVSFAPFNETQPEIKDFFGFTRTQNFFNDRFDKVDDASKFAIKPDTTSPELIGVDFDGTAINIDFSEPMAHYTQDLLIIPQMGQSKEAQASYIAGTPEFDVSQASNVAKNYHIEVKNTKGEFVYSDNLFIAGGMVYLKNENPTKAKVELTGTSPLKSWLLKGNTFRIRINERVQDPAGNSFNPQKNQVESLIQ